MPVKKGSDIKAGTLQQGIRHALGNQLRGTESYTSLILGIIIIILAGVLLMFIVKNKQAGDLSEPTTEVSSTKTENIQGSLNEIKDLPITYKVAEGDSLWSISEKVYKSGYSWVEIAKANNLENPGVIEIGQKLQLPKIEFKVATVSLNSEKTDTVAKEQNISGSISGKTYTVQKGDYLWDIAVRAYGDGFRWVDIAKANNLENPDLIFSENVLNIPR